MIIRSSFFAAALLNLAASGLFGSLPQGKLRVVVAFEKLRPYPQDLYGVNCEMMRRLSYLDPGFQEIYVAAERPLIRYPGGTTANYWNPLTGFMDVFPGHERRSVDANEAIGKRTGGKGEPWAEFFKFVEQAKAPYSITLNLCTLSVESNVRWLDALRRMGAKPPIFEMGNEVHYHEYADFFANGSAYAEKAGRLSALVRERFPEARIGVVIPNVAYTEEVFLDELVPGKKADRRFDEWVQALQGKAFFDAVVLHLYSVYGMPADTKAADFWPLSRSYRFAMAHQDRQFDLCMDAVSKLFPGKPVWLTEYHLGGWSPTLRQYQLGDSYLGSLHSMAMLLKAFRRPEIAMAHRNTFASMLGGSVAPDGVGRVRNNAFRLFHLMGHAIRGMQRFALPQLEGVESYEAEGKYQGNYPEVEAGVFWKDRVGYLVLVNKMDRGYLMNAPLLRDAGSDTPLKVTEVMQYAPRSDVAEASAFEDRFQMREERRESIEGALVLPPYSITRVAVSR